MSVNRLDSFALFTPGHKKLWLDKSKPIPEGVYVYDSESKVIKIGNGTDLFDDLDAWIDINQIKEILKNGIHDESELDIVGDINIPQNADDIITISDETYIPSGVKLQNIIDSIDAIDSKNDTQDNTLLVIGNKTNEIDYNFSSGDANSLTKIESNKIVSVGKTAEQNHNETVNNLIFLFSSDIIDIGFYKESQLYNKVDAFRDYDDYYATIKYKNLLDHTIQNFQLSCNDDNISINELSDNLFEISISSGFSGQVEFTASIYDSDIPMTKTFNKKMLVDPFVAEVKMNGYNSSLTYFNDIVMDNNGDYAVVGIGNDDQGNSVGILCKFDKNLNLLDKRVYGEDSDIIFNSIDVDNDGKYIVVGYIDDVNTTGIVLKLDENFNILLSEKIDKTDEDTILMDVKVDHSDNTYIIGGHSSCDTANIAIPILIKLNNDLSISYKNYYENNEKGRCGAVYVDSDGNYILAGYTYKNNNNGIPIFLMKLNPADGSILDQTSFGYSGVADLNHKNICYDIIENSNGNYIIAGQNANKSLIVIVDKTSLSVIDNITYIGSDYAENAAKALGIYGNKILYSGYADYYSNGNKDILYSRLNSDLSIDRNTFIYDTEEGIINSMIVDGNKAVCVGKLNNNNSDYMNGVIVKFNNDVIPKNGFYYSDVIGYNLQATENVTASKDTMIEADPVFNSSTSTLEINSLILNDEDTSTFEELYDTFPSLSGNT